MIVEFIGCTGSGKTTLINHVRSRLAETTQVVTAHELVAGRLSLGVAAHPTTRNLIEELAGLPFFLGSMPRHQAFIAHTVRLFTRNSRLSLTAINNLRSLERKIGGYEIIMRHHPDTIVLVDEGPIQAAHMFAYSLALPSLWDIGRFADLVPLPDLIVYVRSPVDALVKRTLGRSDPPREMRSKYAATTEIYVRSAVNVFDRLVQSDNLCNRVLIVENTDQMQPMYSDLVEQVAQYILNRGPAHYQTILPDRLIPEPS
jgi:thymidylate kinase